MIATTRANEAAWCTFVVADALYGVELERVQEVLRAQPITRVPLAAPALVGLLNLRGRIVPAVDLRTVLGLPPRRPGTRRGEQDSGLVVVRGADGPVALVVDAIADVRRAIEAPAAAQRAIPPAREASDPRFACAVPLPERLLVVLDLDHTLELAFTRPAADSGPEAAAEAPAGDRS